MVIPDTATIINRKCISVNPKSTYLRLPTVYCGRLAVKNCPHQIQS